MLNSSLLGAMFLASVTIHAQELIPRAYLITPVGCNAVTFSYSWNDGNLVFEPSVPIEQGKGRFSTQILSYYRSFGLLGRSSNLVVSLPYAVGNFEGVVNSRKGEVYRSGLVDARIRFSIDLRGGPAMDLQQFLKWRVKWLLGATLTAVVPIDQNDPARVINPGTNRWAFKPKSELPGVGDM